MKKTFTYTIGDKVWLMDHDQAVCATVVKVDYKIFISYINEPAFEYEHYTLSIDGTQNGYHSREDLFPTKADLINSL